MRNVETPMCLHLDLMVVLIPPVAEGAGLRAVASSELADITR